jgi:general nucleoside transport system permease protein
LGLAGVIAAGAPIVLAAIGETLTERAGVINLSLNGLIILSAMMGFWVAVETDSLVLGFLAVPWWVRWYRPSWRLAASP